MLVLPGQVEQIVRGVRNGRSCGFLRLRRIEGLKFPQGPVPALRTYPMLAGSTVLNTPPRWCESSRRSPTRHTSGPREGRVRIGQPHFAGLKMGSRKPRTHSPHREPRCDDLGAMLADSPARSATVRNGCACGTDAPKRLMTPTAIEVAFSSFSTAESGDPRISLSSRRALSAVSASSNNTDERPPNSHSASASRRGPGSGNANLTVAFAPFAMAAGAT